MKNLFEIGVERYVRDNVQQLMASSDREVSIDVNSLRVVANILDDRIQVAVFLPTTVADYPIQQPYDTVDVPTRIGRIYLSLKDGRFTRNTLTLKNLKTSSTAL